MNAKLFADSGGSKTDWCFVNQLGEEYYFETESYHPNRFSDAFFERQQIFWDAKFPAGTELYFYGAGCSLESNKQVLKLFFRQLGFDVVEIESDLYGVCMAAFGQTNGCVAILGTGSVFASWENGAIKHTIGGLGYLLGDEGSGFAAGREILRRLLSSQFSAELSAELHENLGSKSEILKKVYGDGGKDYISSLAKISPDSVEIHKIHEENLQLFTEGLRKQHFETITKFIVIGTYGCVNGLILIDLISKLVDVKIEFIQKPITSIVEFKQSVKKTN